MPLQALKAGSTSVILPDVFLQDSSQSDGRGLAGLVFNTASLTCYYHRNTANASVAVSLITMTLGTFAAGGFKEVDATNMPGIYSFCPPDAALASGAQSVTFYFRGATNLAQTPFQITLQLLDPQDVVRAGLTALPNFAANAAGGLPVSIAGALDLDEMNADIELIQAKTDNLPVDPADASDLAASFVTVNATLATIAGYIDTEVAAIKAKTDLIPASPAAVSNIPTAAAIVAAWQALTLSNANSYAEAMEFICAMVGGGKTSGAVASGTQTYVVRNLADNADLASILNDGVGNRTTVTW